MRQIPDKYVAVTTPVLPGEVARLVKPIMNVHQIPLENIHKYHCECTSGSIRKKIHKIVLQTSNIKKNVDLCRFLQVFLKILKNYHIFGTISNINI